MYVFIHYSCQLSYVSSFSPSQYFFRMRGLRLSPASIMVIICLFLCRGALARNTKSAAIDAGYDSIKSDLNRLRNQASKLRYQRQAFASQSDQALSSLVKKEKEDNSAALGLSTVMKKHLSEVIDSIDNNFNRRIA